MNVASKIQKALSHTAGMIFPNGGGEVYLYGSRARGDAREDSDWDVLVITDSEPDNDENYRKFAFPFAELGWDFGAQITPLLYSRSDWNKIKDTSFHMNVLSDAIRL